MIVCEVNNFNIVDVIVIFWGTSFSRTPANKYPDSPNKLKFFWLIYSYFQMNFVYLPNWTIIRASPMSISDTVIASTEHKSIDDQIFFPRFFMCKTYFKFSFTCIDEKARLLVNLFLRKQKFNLKSWEIIINKTTTWICLYLIIIYYCLFSIEDL